MRQTLLAWQLTKRTSIADDHIHINVITNENKELLFGKTSPQISKDTNICDGWKYNSGLAQYLSDRYWK